MQDEYIKELLEKYKTGTITDAEKAVLDKWYLHVAADRSGELSEAERLATFDEVLGHLNQTIYARKTARLWPRIAAAASILLLLGAGTYYFLHPNAPKQRVAQQQPHDIAPGKQTATLTLANGQQIVLNQAANGRIASQAGVQISKAANGQLTYTIADQATETNQMNTLATANGETYKVNLPDGTQVWLNAASSLTYPARFTGTDRKVTLTGEAYFEVAKDKLHPFKVNTSTQEVTVLGTHFNVNAYPDEAAVATTLLEGSVKVSSDQTNAVIKPGEQALTSAKGIQVNEHPNLDAITDWKDGDFALNGQNFKTAMRKIARWYNVEVVYDASVPDAMQAGGWISRNNNISAVLKLIESSGQVRFKVEGRRITVTK